MTEKIQSIPARIKNIAKGGHVAGTEDIIDDASGKTQKEINTAVDNNVDSLKAKDTNLDSRLSTVEQLAEISVEGGTIGIATGTDFDNPTAEQRAKVTTVGAILDGADDEPTAGSNNLVKSGGVASTYGSYVENPEFIHVKTDSEGRILWAIKTDGSIYYGAGVPQQVIDYIEQKIADLSLDEYEDIVAFLNNLEKGDKTLQDLLNEKVDKVEGKSLIDSEFAAGVSHIENPEFVYVQTDNKDKILFGIKANGELYFGVGCPKQIIDYVEQKIAELSLDEYENMVSFLQGYLGGDITLKAIIGEWNNVAQGKKISILGDSISTFDQEGYKIDGYVMWYPHQDDRSSDVVTVNDTWWKQVIDATESTLEVNASYSGSTASNRYVGFSSRVSLLGNPDIIIIALGTNDSFKNVEIGDINFNASEYDLAKFAPAYIKGMQDTIATYPKAKIVCVAFDMGADYHNAIKTIAEHYGAEYIYVGDISDVHPNKAEMTAVANKIIPSAKHTITDAIKTLSNGKVDKETGKSLIAADFATGIRYVENSEWIYALLDSNNRLIKGVRTNGICYLNKIESPSLDNIKDDVLGINQKIPIEATPTNKLADKEFVLAAISGMQSNYVTTLTGEAIQNAIDAGGVVELVPNATYICDSTIIWWYNKSIVHGNGATLLFPSDFSGVAVKARARHYPAQELLPFPNYFVRTFSGCIITKDGVTSKWSKRDDDDTTPGAQVRSGTGLSFEGAIIQDGTTYSVAAKVDNCAIYGFDTGVIIGSYTWMVQIDHCDVCYNKYGLRVINGGNNYGESIRVTNCLLGGNCYGVWCSHMYGTVNVIDTSFDYGYCAICVDNGGHVFCTNCHLETTKDMDYYLKGTGKGTICVSNSVIYFNQSVYSFIGTSDSIGTQKCIFVIDNCVREAYSSPTNNINQQSEIRENGINY